MFYNEFLFEGNETIGDTDFKNYFPGVNNNMKFTSLFPYVKGATRSYLIPYLGTEFLHKLYDENASPGIDDVLAEVLQLVKSALAYYTIYDAVPHLNTIISDMGIKETSGDDVRPITQWKFKSVRWNAILKADDFLDQAISILEENKANYSPWTDSTAYGRNNSLYFPDTITLKDHISIDGRRAFLALIPYLEVAELKIKPLICGEESVIAEDLDSGDTEKLMLVKLCRYYISRMAIYDGMPHLNLLFDGSGYKLVSKTDSFDSRNNSAQISAIAFDKIRPIVMQQILEFESQIISHLRAYPDIFTGYAEKHADLVEDINVIASDDCIGGIGIF